MRRREKKQDKPKEVTIGVVEDRSLTKEMEESYLDYAMSVIVSRALPDARDGLKPVHRRILYAMGEMGLRSNAKYRKSAAVVGQVLGRYHPHGDAAVYESMVRLAQDFSMRYPMVDGQGNFGCFTKDTRVKLTDNRDLTFEELIKEARQGKINYTYTVNRAGLISIAEIKNPRLTRKRAEIIKVILDNGEEIKCTPNHLFMLNNGVYKEVRDLQINDSLMPLYQKMSEKTDRLNREGYILIYQPKNNTWSPAHHLADNYNLSAKTYFKNNIDLVRQAINRNHRIVRIEKIDNNEDVYDLTIENTHNFCLSAGVFVHNSMDGDAAAAQRYTEVRLTALAEAMLLDIEKDTVPFTDNYDATQKEPRVLPAKLPNLLLNGTTGIAVGMATNIAPHNLREVIDGINFLADNPECGTEDLMNYIPGPDFPTGGIIYNIKEIERAYATGRGGITLRAKTEIVEEEGFHKILVTEIPYQINKAALLEKIAELVKLGRIEEIKDLRDESSKGLVRIVIELKKNAYPQKVLNRLFKLTTLQTSFNFNMLALVSGIQPKVLSLKELLHEYLEHRKEMVKRRTAYDLERAKERAHILEGLVKALACIDKIISTIKKSKDRDEAKVNLIKKFRFTERQAEAILEMRLQQLANLERLKVETELKEKKKLMKDLSDILASPKRILKVVRDEFSELREKFGDDRRTKIVKQAVGEFSQEDLIPNEPTVVLVTRDGYIKRLPPETFKTQGRGGKGVVGLTTKEEDVVEHILSVKTHDDLLFFTTRGRVFQLKAYDVPPASRIAKGQALVNFLQIAPDERMTTIQKLADLESFTYLVMATKNGVIKKVDIKDFEKVRRSGLIAIRLKENDELRWVRPSGGKDEIILVTRQGQAIHFKEKDIRAMGRVAAGVRGIRLKKKDDEVVGMDVIASGKMSANAELLVVTGQGYGKRTKLSAYKVQGRGGSGVLTTKMSKKIGPIISAFVIDVKNISEIAKGDIFVISDKGQVIRLPVKSVSSLGRATQGVRIMRLKEKDDHVASAALV